MNAVTRLIRLLLVVAVINYASCQDGYSEQDLLSYQQQLSNPNNEGQVETITSYSTNVIQRDPIRNEHSISSVSVQYHLTDDDAEKSNNYHPGRSDRRKVFRIKNPFQRQLEPNDRPEPADDITAPQDSNLGASNQYASMQYSLPPEEFLQKLRAENQQQASYLQQVSTPNPLLSYTATPQSAYQYSTISSNNYDNIQKQQQQQQQQQQIQQQQNLNQQANQISQLEQKIAQAQSQFQANPAAYQQYAGSFAFDTVQSTPSPLPPFLSTAANQFIGTPTNAYVSSASPVFLSSQPSVQQYVSSPVSVVQTGSPDYSNSVSTVAGNTGYDPNQNKRIQIDHYDNSANGMRYPSNLQQYSTPFPSSTPAPSSSPYSDPVHDSWQNAINAGVNSLTKTLQEYSLSQYQNSPYNANQQEGRSDVSPENPNTEIHRISNVPVGNNPYSEYAQQEYQTYNRQRARDLEHQASQPGIYSSGDYGWKVNEKKPVNDGYASGSSPTRYQTFGYSADGNAVSQMNFYLDSSRSQNYDQISKSSAESHDAREFAKAAAKAQENMKQQQLARLAESYFGHNHYSPSYGSMRNNQPQSVSSYYTNTEGPKGKLYADSSNTNTVVYGNSQSQDLITASPYFYGNTKENYFDNKQKQPFDHAKALKNIVPIDVSNVIGTEGSKPTVLDTSNRYNGIPNLSKEQLEHNLKQFYKPVTESYYKDKNSGYGFNIKVKPDDVTGPDSIRQFEQSMQYYGKQSPTESLYGAGIAGDNKRYGETGSQQFNYLSQTSNNFPTVQSSPQPPVQNSPQRPINPNQQTEVLKFNDIPYRLTQGLSSESLRLNNNNFDQGTIPTPIPPRINQNVDSHQIDVANHILHKLMQSKQPLVNGNNQDLELQSAGLSNINGFRVANPFNVDLKLVADLLKGKPTLDDSHMLGLRDQFNKQNPIKLDMSALQQLLLKADNYGTLGSYSGGLTSIGNPYYDIYNGRYPYQGVKYSRSQEEEENIPIADASNTHPIGAVIEQEDSPDAREVSEGTDLTASDGVVNIYEDNRPKNVYSNDHKVSERHPNLLSPSRHSYPRKYPKSDVAEPYPLLKPPPQHSHRSRSGHSKIEKRGPRRRRVNRPKYARVLKTEPLFEAESSPEERRVEHNHVPTVLRPPPQIPEAKSDVVEDEHST